MRALVVVAVLGLAPAVALADSNAKQTAERGFEAFDRGEYATAISYFERAYELEPVAGLLFNIAQAYRKLGESGCERALAYYRRYEAALSDSGVPVQEGLRARIVEMQACVESGVPPEAEPEPEPERDEQAPRIDVRNEPRASPRKRRAGWILLGGAGVFAATAAVTGALAVQRQSDLSSQCTDGVCAPSLESDVRSYDRLRFAAFVSGTVSVAALAAGGYLVLSSSRSESPAHVAAVPVVGHNSIGVRCEF